MSVEVLLDVDAGNALERLGLVQGATGDLAEWLAGSAEIEEIWL